MKHIQSIFGTFCALILIVAHTHTNTQTLPIVYSHNYNISFFGIEKLSPFDSRKYNKIATALSSYLNTPIKKLFHEPSSKVSDAELLKFHTQTYITSLNNSTVVARIAEIPLLRWIPNALVRYGLLSPMRYATQGTRMAADLAWRNKQYAINLGGGFHHARPNSGDGFCAFGDIQLAMLDIWNIKPNAKIMYIDLDAHQGDGVELGLETYIKNTDDTLPRLVVFDIYGDDNYPWYNKARDYIHYGYPIGDLLLHKRARMTDADYLALVEQLKTIIPHENPDIIFYNAGTDVYKDDPLGRLNLSKEGIIKRDAMVFEYAKENNIPIIMTLSGGYTKESAAIVSESIRNVLTKIWDVQPQPHAQNATPTHWWHRLFRK